MDKIKSFNEIKKTADKYSWELYIFSKDGLPGNNLTHKFLNVIRKVKKLQTNAIMFEGGSWLYFPKADNVKIERYLYNDKDIIVTIKEDKFPVLSYHLRSII